MQCCSREHIKNLAKRGKHILEIGPYLTPFLRGPNVKYLDVITKEEMLARAKNDPGYSFDPNLAPDRIDYIITRPEDYASIPDKFDVVFSSHNIEHQHDFIGHLQAIANLLTDNGKFYLCIPDKRYCFDHFKQISTFCEMIDVHESHLPTSSLGKFIYSAIFSTHNSSIRHWQNDHGDKKTDIPEIKRLIRLYHSLREQNKYADAHNWHFTPISFNVNCIILFSLKYITLFPLFVSTTTKNSNEFYACLMKTNETVAEDKYCVYSSDFYDFNE